MNTLAAPLELPGSGGYVSLGAAVICFVIAALFKTRPLAKLEPAIPFVLLIGGCGIANVFGDSIRGFLRQGAGALPWGIGAVLLTALAFYLAYCFFYDVFPNHRTTPMTAKAAITLPTVAPAMGGALGSVCLSIVTMIGGVGATILSKGLGV